MSLLATGIVAHAASAGATVKLGPTGALANPPSSVIVTVTYSCLPSDFSFGQVVIDEAIPSGAASGSRTDIFGFGGFQPTCDDKTHKADVVVSTFDGSSFLPGTAGASAFVSGGAVFANTSSEISIR